MTGYMQNMSDYKKYRLENICISKNYKFAAYKPINYYPMKKLAILFLVTSITIAFFTTFAQDCAPATITKVEKEDAGNRITWTLPTSGEKFIVSQGEDFANKNAGNSVSFSVFHRFRPEDLVTVDQGELKQVVFAPTFRPFQKKPGHTYTIQIYEGGTWGTEDNRSPGTLLVSQELDNNDLIFNTENTITLETPVSIDASQELWIGYFCFKIDSIQTPGKSPAGIDDSPYEEGLGNIMFYDNQWYTLSELSYIDETNNWYIKGIVQTVEGLSVNIYHNDNLIDTDVQGTTYLHNDTIGEEHCYKIEINCLEGGVSLLSNEICIEDNSISEQIMKFSIFPNPANNELRITNYELRDGIIEIYDVYGRRLLTSLLITSSSNHLINISSLSSGIYFVKLSDEQGSYIQRFIKQ